MRTVAAAARARLVTAAASAGAVPAGSLVTRGLGRGRPRRPHRSPSASSPVRPPPWSTVRRSPAPPRTRRQFTLIGQPHRPHRRPRHRHRPGRLRPRRRRRRARCRPSWPGPPTIGGTVALGRRPPRPGPCPASSPSPGSPAASPSPPRPSTRPRRPGTRCASRGTRARTPGSRDAEIFARLPPGHGARSSRRPLGPLAVDRTFEFAFAPHAPLEVLHVRRRRPRRPGRGLVLGRRARSCAARRSPPPSACRQDAVTLHVVRGGGSFGHRLFFEPAIEAAQVSKAIGRPVKLMWTRNDDMRHGRMRPASHHKVRATHLLGSVLAYEHRHADPAGRLLATASARRSRGAGFDVLSVGRHADRVPAHPEGALRLRRRRPSCSADVPLDVPDRVAGARSTPGQTATVNEIMVDEIARAPRRRTRVAFRRAAS